MNADASEKKPEMLHKPRCGAINVRKLNVEAC